MDISSVLLGVIVLLGTTAICMILFEELGFGVILGFIVAGIFLGPHTPGPVPVQAVDKLQSIAELGVVMFLFTVGLEMRPGKVWSMRRLIFGLGSAQMLLTATFLAVYLVVFVNVSWETAIIVGLGLSMSSMAIVMAILGERGELNTEQGQTIFAVLMSQDIWIVPVMALVPILAHKTVETNVVPVWLKVALLVAVLMGIFFVGRYLLPIILGYCARRHQMDVFAVVLFLAVIGAAYIVEHVGISMTLGAFFLGMLLSASDFRYQIEAIVAPFKMTLMGLFFISVGMSIDTGALLDDWSTLLGHVLIVLLIKSVVLTGLVLLFGIGRSVAIRTGFYLSQAGEFAFVLFGAAAVSGLLSSQGYTLALLVVAISMITTSLMVKAGDKLAQQFAIPPAGEDINMATELDQHVVVIGYGEEGQLIDLILEKANIPHIVIDPDINVVSKGGRAGRPVYFGDMSSPTIQVTAGLARAAAVYVTLQNLERSKQLAITLHSLYPNLNVFIRVQTFEEKDELGAQGIGNAVTGYIESTLVHGRLLLEGLDVSESEIEEVLTELRQDEYAAIRAGQLTAGG